ncbi:hypothetical protein NC652_038144 [Populus alba x Populus x berolinensis]|nr:hypothetical protein NC652_038144 [Populus alba x Populus x berolinensis]
MLFVKKQGNLIISVQCKPLDVWLPCGICFRGQYIQRLALARNLHLTSDLE